MTQGLYFVTFHLYTQSQRDAACCLSCCRLRSYRCCTWQRRQTAVWLPPHLAITTDNRRNLLTRAHLHTRTHTHRGVSVRYNVCMRTSAASDERITVAHVIPTAKTGTTDRQTDGEADRQTTPTPPPLKKHLWRYEPHFPRAPRPHINKIFSCNKTQTRLVCGEGLRMYSAAIQCVSFCQLRE